MELHTNWEVKLNGGCYGENPYYRKNVITLLFLEESFWYILEFSS